MADRVDAVRLADVGVQVNAHHSTVCLSRRREAREDHKTIVVSVLRILRVFVMNRRWMVGTKQKGTALLRCPPAPLIWLPQQFTAPCRNQISDLSRPIAMGVPAGFRGKLKN